MRAYRSTTMAQGSISSLRLAIWPVRQVTSCVNLSQHPLIEKLYRLKSKTSALFLEDLNLRSHTNLPSLDALASLKERKHANQFREEHPANAFSYPIDDFED
jgi:hypothetical protein